MNWTNQSVKKNVVRINVFSVFGSLDFTRSVFVLFLLSRGLTNGQVGVLQSLLFFSLCLVEIPSGILADRFKRKYTIAAGCVLSVAALSFYLFSSSFWPYLIAFTLFGIGLACISGANIALLYDGLEQVGGHWVQKFRHILGNMRVLASFATATAMLVSGFIYEKDPKLVFILTIIATGLAAITIVSVDEPKRKGNPPGQNNGLCQSIVIFFKSPKGRRLIPFILGMGFIEAVHTPFFIYSQSLFKSFSFGAEEISVLLGCGFAVSAVAIRFASWLSRWNLKVVVTVIGFIVMGMLITVGFTKNGYLVVALFFLINALPNMLFVLTDSYIQDNCDSSIRASLSSIQSFTMAMFTSLSYLIIGFMADAFTIRTAIAISALLIIPGLLLIGKHFSGATKNEISASA